MAIVTAQQLQDYYDHYRDSEITLTKDMTRILSLDPRQIYIKCNGNQWPCIINSTSLIACKIIVGVKGGAYAMLSKKEENPISVSIRFCFINTDRQPVPFFVNGRVQEINSYMNSQELAVITIAFTQRPPDDLIEKLGQLFDANANAIRRKEERIVLNPEVKRKLGLEKEETLIQVQGVPRHCILRDISFSGTKVLMMGIQKFVLNQPAILQMRFEDPQETVQLNGTIVSAEPVEGRKDIIAAAIKFDENTIPFPYKIRINNFLVNAKKYMLTPEQQAKQAAAQTPAPAAAPEKPAKPAPVVEAELPDM